MSVVVVVVVVRVIVVWIVIVRYGVLIFIGDLKDAKKFFNRLKNEAFEHQKALRDNIRLKTV